ncbi:unnamed protein product [Amoebophrya sp. A120]|nr:unnamed protein product [Amoebophrya sp. A120]|eukprot:GSA120T00014180001.1
MALRIFSRILRRSKRCSIIVHFSSLFCFSIPFCWGENFLKSLCQIRILLFLVSSVGVFFLIEFFFQFTSNEKSSSCQSATALMVSIQYFTFPISFLSSLPLASIPRRSPDSIFLSGFLRQGREALLDVWRFIGFFHYDEENKMLLLRTTAQSCCISLTPLRRRCV